MVQLGSRTGREGSQARATAVYTSSEPLPCAPQALSSFVWARRLRLAAPDPLPQAGSPLEQDPTEKAPIGVKPCLFQPLPGRRWQRGQGGRDPMVTKTGSREFPLTTCSAMWVLWSSLRL